MVNVGLMYILTPELRKYINYKLKVFYDKLVIDYNVNTLENSLQDHKAIGKSNFYFKISPLGGAP